MERRFVGFAGESQLKEVEMEMIDIGRYMQMEKASLVLSSYLQVHVTSRSTTI